jgi:DNA-binding Lrp family transcriptional regulator
VTSKKHRQAIADSLSSALEPPKSRRPSPALNEILSQYAPAAPSPDEAPSHGEGASRREAPSPITAQPLHREGAVRHEGASQREGASILPATAPHLRFAYEVLDQTLVKLDPYPRAVLLRLYRLSAGWNSDTCRVSIGKLAEHCKMGVTKVRACLRTLEADGYIKRDSIDLSNKNQNERGITFTVLLPRLAPPRREAPPRYEGASPREAPSYREPNKEKALKETNKKGINRLTPEEIQSFTSTVADLLGEGQAIEVVEARFAPNMHAVDWATIRSTALAQVAPKKGK